MSSRLGEYQDETDEHNSEVLNRDTDDNEDETSDSEASYRTMLIGNNAQLPSVLDAMSQLTSAASEIPDIRRLLERVVSRFGGQPLGRLDALLLQVLLARVSLAELQYQQQLREALRISLEESQDKAQGPAPSSDEDIANLPSVVLMKEHLESSDKTSCVVCLELYKVGYVVKQLPCSHLFCEQCIVPWLKRHGTCPLCREEVRDVSKSAFLSNVCGYRQLCPDMCICTSSSTLIALPNCSHVFSIECIKVNVTYCEPSCSPQHKLVHCVLCEKVSPVNTSHLSTSLKSLRNSAPNWHPLRNREPNESGWTPHFNDSDECCNDDMVSNSEDMDDQRLTVHSPSSSSREGGMFSYTADESSTGSSPHPMFVSSGMFPSPSRGVLPLRYESAFLSHHHGTVAPVLSHSMDHSVVTQTSPRIFMHPLFASNPSIWPRTAPPPGTIRRLANVRRPPALPRIPLRPPPGLILTNLRPV